MFLHLWRAIDHTVLLALSYFCYIFCAVDWWISSSQSLDWKANSTTYQTYLACSKLWKCHCPHPLITGVPWEFLTQEPPLNTAFLSDWPGSFYQGSSYLCSCIFLILPQDNKSADIDSSVIARKGFPLGPRGWRKIRDIIY